MANELKPCPFCGGAAHIERFGTTRVSTLYSCEDCSCNLETGETDNYGERWNTRANALMDMRQGDGWQPIETAPKDGSRFWAIVRTECRSGNELPMRQLEMWWEDEHLIDVDENGYWQDDWDLALSPTHWMPLLAPPAPQAQEGE